MRAWLLLLTVLATFKPIVQVASTDDTSTSTALTTRSATMRSSSSLMTSSSAFLPVIDKTSSAYSTSSDSDKLYNDSNSKTKLKNLLKQSTEENLSKQLEIFTNQSQNCNNNSDDQMMAINVDDHTATTQFNVHYEEKRRNNAATEDLIDHLDDHYHRHTMKSTRTDDPTIYTNSKVFIADPETAENTLWSLFQMKRPPKIDRTKIIIPDAMKLLYAQMMGHDIDSVNIPKPGLLTKSANTVRSFTHQDSKIDDRFPNHHRFRLYFDVTSIPTDDKLKAAELQLSRDVISSPALSDRLANRTRYQILVYDITRVGIKGQREPSYLLLDNKTVRLNSTETVSLDVQPAVDRWLGKPKRNFGLLIEVRTHRTLQPAPHHHVRLRRSADEPHEVWKHKQPLLFTYTDDGRHKARSIRDVSTRSKRAHHHRRPHRRKNNEESCRRHSLYVDFADVGWSDWIVAPPGYDAYYCHGKCPFPLAEHLNSTNHAVVQTLVNNINPGKVPKACCVPTQLTGISMLYLNDQNTVVLKNYQDMTVVGCGCR